MRIKTSMNSKEFKTIGEKNYSPTMTIPDQTMSIRQILERHSRGLPVEGWREPIWEGEDNDLPDIRTLDLAERQELAVLYQQELNNYNKTTNVDKNNERVDEIESISGEPSTDL